MALLLLFGKGIIQENLQTNNGYIIGTFYYTVPCLLENKILDLSNLKTFADDKNNATLLCSFDF